MVLRAPVCYDGRSLSDMRLLIVDDHPEVRNLIRHVAAASATTVRECGNGREAVELVREFKPHCITLDIRLPGLGGIDAASAIRAVHPSARIAMVSSYDGPELRQAARLAGARCYVLKDHLVDLGNWLAEQAELRQMRQSSERFRVLLDHSLDLLLETTREGVILYVSPNVRGILGYAPEELCRRNIFDHVHPADIEGAQSAFRLPQGRLACRYRHKNGTWRWIETVGREFIASDERPRSVLSVRDISDLKRVEEERLRLESDIREHGRVCDLGHLTAGIAHDFNNLLAPIGMMVQLAQIDNAQPELVTTLAQIEAAVKRGQSLVRQLLAPALSRRRELVPVGLPALAQEAIQLFAPTLPSTLRLISEFDPRGGWIRADSTQIHQVLINLLSNAVQAVGSAPGQVEVRVGFDPDAKVVRLTVADNGCGMSAETQRRIFEPFFTTKSETGGTGLGMASVQRIVSEHGGSIAVTSAVGNGSAFAISFPAISDD
jgi:PAS domain S-box-containing protein